MCKQLLGYYKLNVRKLFRNDLYHLLEDPKEKGQLNSDKIRCKIAGLNLNYNKIYTKYR